MNNIPPRQGINGKPSADLGKVNPPPGDGADFGQGGAYSADPLSDADAMAQPGALVSIHAAALHANADSFPVLKSFQDYLEAERARARHRMFVMAGMFIALMFIVVVGFIVGGVMLFGYMSRQQNALISIALQGGAQQQPAAVQQPAPVAPIAQPVAVQPAQPALPVAQQPTVSPQPEPVAQGTETVAAQSQETPADTQPQFAIAAPAEPAAEAPSVPAETQGQQVAATQPAEEQAAPAPAEAVAEAPSPTPAEPVPAPAAPRLAPIDESKTVASVEPPPEGFAEDTVYISSPKSGERIPWTFYLPVK